MHNAVRCLLVGITILIAGCTGLGILETTQPLSDALTGEPDESLFGHWVAKHENSELHFFIGDGQAKAERDPESLMAASAVLWDTSKRNVITIPFFHFTVTRIGKGSYINWLTWKEGKEPPIASAGVINNDRGYSDWLRSKNRMVGVLKYSVEGNRLKFWTKENPGSLGKTLTKLSDERQLKVSGNLVSIESLVKYLRANESNALFDHLIEFERAP